MHYFEAVCGFKLETHNWIKITDFSARVTEKLDGGPTKTNKQKQMIGLLFCQFVL